MTRSAATALLVLLLTLTACGGADDGGDVADDPVPSGTGDAARGEEVYDRTCVVCHGQGGTGTDQGPPFLHDVYVPSHHADGAFLAAVRTGVQAHHWEFGPMPPVPGLSDQEVADVVAYVRSLQREAGLID